MRESGKPHYAFIDCVRGYAVLLVVLVHATYLFPNLPYPIHRLTVVGWDGAQLFFLASAVTLMTSWRHEMAQYGQVDVGAVFIRRFFRIAPAYYAASVLYFALDPPAAGFKVWRPPPPSCSSTRGIPFSCRRFRGLGRWCQAVGVSASSLPSIRPFHSSPASSHRAREPHGSCWPRFCSAQR